MKPPLNRCAFNRRSDAEVDEFHVSVTNVLFADGHAKFLSASTDIRLVARLITPRSSEVIANN